MLYILIEEIEKIEEIKESDRLGMEFNKIHDKWTLNNQERGTRYGGPHGRDR